MYLITLIVFCPPSYVTRTTAPTGVCDAAAHTQNKSRIAIHLRCSNSNLEYSTSQ